MRTFRSVLGMAAVMAASVMAYNNGVGKPPAMGWNTWCTEGDCGNPVPGGGTSLHDVCNETEIESVADAMIKNGMQALGYEYVNCDDCWEADARTASGAIQADPSRFPSGYAAHVATLHSKGFKAGLYLSMGTTTCSSGGRPHSIPGSYGHYPEDAATVASWDIDYVKVDWCGSELTNATQQHTEMSHALNSTGRPIWLELCRGYSFPAPDYVAQVANSWRVMGDHHDNWASTASAIEGVAGHTTLSGPYNWAYNDFLMTGGAGCDTYTVGAHCPGQTDPEYRTEFIIWSITASPLIVATDVRVLTPIMEQLLLNEEIIAVNQDYRAKAGDRLGYWDCSQILACQIWTRALSNDTMAIALYNSGSESHDITIPFDRLPAEWADGGYIRDLVYHKDLGHFSGNFTARVDSHDTVLVRLSHSAMGPARRWYK